MSKLTPCSRRELVRKLQKAGFKGPYAGGKHSWMEKENIRLTIPNPHQSDIDVKLIRKIIKRAGIEVTKWLSL